MASSLRQSAACIGIGGNFSVLRDYFGYGSVPQPLSLRTQMRRLQHKHVHMNLIRVGVESFTVDDERELDAAVQFTRDVYATVDVGVGRVRRFFVTTDEANGRDNIGGADEAESLTDEWTVPNQALDVFFVLSYAGDTIGRSAVDGPCDKNAKGMDGSVVAIEGSFSTTGTVLAHEVGHYLGLEHVTSNANLMFKSVPNGGGLSAKQGSNMRDHCFVRPAC